MIQKKLISSLMAGLIIAGQLSLTGEVLAANSKGEDSAKPSVAAQSSPSASPSAAPTPKAFASPSPSTSPTHDGDSHKSATGASSSPQPKAAAAKSEQSSGKANSTGPGACTGVVPDWVFDATAQRWVSADKPSFSCDSKSGYWLSPKYEYDKRDGWYQIMAPSAASRPDYLITAPNVVHTVLGDLVVGSKDYETAKAMGLIGAGSNGIELSGPGSSNQTSTNNQDKSWVDLTNLVNVVNTLQSGATSGNVAAGSNTQVGSSSSGAAAVVANLINLLASAWSWSNGSLNFFMQNILGNQTGDITLNPSQLVNGGGGQLGGSGINTSGPGSTNATQVNNGSTLDVNAKNSGNIVNNVNLNAQSGNANATKNTVAGDVGSGSALAQVNIVNLINSFITSGNSFFGILNVFGSLNGDILFPSGFLNGLVGSSPAPAAGSNVGVNATGPGSVNGASTNNSLQADITGATNNQVNNNIKTTAASGQASASANTQSGNVQSGNSQTTQGLFNLSNSSIFGDNAVLVMVNVLGHWVGKIMTIPGGQTQSALLTGNAQVGVNSTGPDSANHVATNNAQKATINQQSNGTITNNVNVNAKSGDASATKNTSVGNVTTGDAKAASSVANIFNSAINVKHWFGVLVINVFGDWFGSVNQNTSAGDAAPSGASLSGSSAGTTAGIVPVAGLKGSVNTPTVSRTGDRSTTGDATPNQTSSVTGNANGKVLTAAAELPGSASAVKTAAQHRDVSLLFGLSAIVMLIAGAMVSIDRRLKQR